MPENSPQFSPRPDMSPAPQVFTVDAVGVINPVPATEKQTTQNTETGHIAFEAGNFAIDGLTMATRGQPNIVDTLDSQVELSWPNPTDTIDTLDSQVELSLPSPSSTADTLGPQVVVPWPEPIAGLEFDDPHDYATSPDPIGYREQTDRVSETHGQF